jgi:amino acid adenylation domain-containing protein
MVDERLFPVSFAQERMLFLDQLDPETAAYNLTRAIRISGELSIEALKRTFVRIIQRHASLRTRFVLDADNAYQIVSDQFDLDVSPIDVSNLPEAARQHELHRIIKEKSLQRFNLLKGPLFRVFIICLGTGEHVLLLIMHHIVTDGWSMSILFEEISKIYAELTLGNDANLPALRIQYSDFARWQRETVTHEKLQPHINYWTDQLGNHSGFIDLPSDYPRPPVQSQSGAVVRFQIHERHATALNRLAEAHETTVFMVLIATFQVLLWRYTGDEDIVVGTPIAGRNDRELERLIGFFVNTLVIRTRFSGDLTFVELLNRVRTKTLEAYDHQELPFEKLIEVINPERTLQATPLFQVMFVLQNAPRQIIELPGLSLEELEVDSGSSKFDLTLDVIEHNGLLCTLEYSTALFERGTIQRFGQHFAILLADIIADPYRPISSLSILDKQTSDTLTIGFNETTAEYRQHSRIEQLFEEQAHRTPDRVALIEGDIQITYQSLDERAGVLAQILVQEGLTQDRPVGIYMHRSIDAVVALLGALKANTPYVPLDLANPEQRLANLIAKAGCSKVMTHRGLDTDLPADVAAISVDKLDVTTGLPGRTETDFFLARGGESSEQLAYIIYTSGSTGSPKGVEGTHRATINRFEWMWRSYPFSEGECCCQKTPLGFVDSVWEIFGPLLAGVPLVIVPDEVLLNAEEFVDLLARNAVTRIVLVPSLLRTLLDAVPDLGKRLPTLNLWSCSGEVLSPALAGGFRELFPTATLLNIYGSSEVTADVTFTEVGLSDRLPTIPIGRPINNTHILLLDRHRNLVPPLVPGEIYVGGHCLARGYWKEPELTSERFIPNPYRSDQSSRLFATGDLGRIHTDGTIEYLGRLDHQIKLRGMRIEPGEIEGNLIAHPAVLEAAVVLQGEGSEKQLLIAYLVKVLGTDLSVQDLRLFLRSRLPDYMIPTRFIELDRMPLLPSGKLNRLALPAPRPSPLSEPPMARARTEIEREMISIWCEVLELTTVGVHDNFFDLGGHSLSAMRVLARVRRNLHVDLSVKTIFDAPTVAQLCSEVESQRAQGRTLDPHFIQHGADGRTLLSLLRTQLKALSPDQVDTLLQMIEDERRGRKNDMN